MFVVTQMTFNKIPGEGPENVNGSPNRPISARGIHQCLRRLNIDIDNSILTPPVLIYGPYAGEKKRPQLIKQATRHSHEDEVQIKGGG